MKQIPIESNWLDDINGMTVADAIEYLKKLPQDHKLDYWMDGPDTHGCGVECQLIMERPFTDEEKAEMAAQRKAKRIADCERAIEWYSKRLERNKAQGNAKWVAHDEELIQKLQAELKELKS